MVLIGSSAIKHHYPDFGREPKDTDYAVRQEIKSGIRDIEYLFNPVLASRYPESAGVATPNDLYTLKISHLFWDINWEKHMFDVQFLKTKGCVIDMPLFDELYLFWNKIHGKNKRSELNMNAASFFDNALNCPYDHDMLHTIINPAPTYTKVLKDGAEVDVCEDKFNAFSFDEKCDLVREEVYIMAWERMSKMDYRIAYGRMLRKFIRNHAPIWEALFIIEHFYDLYKPQFNYFKKIENGLQEIK